MPDPIATGSRRRAGQVRRFDVQAGEETYRLIRSLGRGAWLIRLLDGPRAGDTTTIRFVDSASYRRHF